MFSLSSAQYVWHPRGEKGYASPDLPPQHRILNAHPDSLYRLPPYSITVVRGRIAETAFFRTHWRKKGK